MTEISAAAGDILVSCWGGTPTAPGAPVPTVDLQIYFNADVTVRKAGSFTESLLLVDEPLPPNQVPCVDDPLICQWSGGSKGANVYQGKILARNALTFQGIPLDPPGDATSRTFRITNVRVDASTLDPQAPSGRYLRAAVTITGQSLINNLLTLGESNRTFTSTVFDSTGSGTPDRYTGLQISNCASTTMLPLATLQFQADAIGAFHTRTIANYLDTETSPSPAAQSIPGADNGTQSLFYSPVFPATNKLNTAGLADSGTRLKATFSGLPNGVTLYVSTVPVSFTGGVPAPNGAGQFQARLVASEQGAFAPVPVAATISGIPVAALSVNQGSAAAVWEVLSSSGLAGETARFPMWISYPGDSSSAGMATVRLQLGPVSNIHTADDTAPIPRFHEEGAEVPLFTLQAGCPTGPYRVGALVYLFVYFEVDGVRYNFPAYFNWQPGSSHTLRAIVQAPSYDGTSRTTATWSDGGAPAHTIIAPATPTNYWLFTNTQYRLELGVIPADGGTIQATPPSTDGYYPSSSLSKVELRAVPNPGFAFAGFEEDLTGSQNPQSITMLSGHKVTAKFTKTGTPPVGMVARSSFFPTPTVTLNASFHADQSYKSILFVQVLAAVAPDGGGQPFCFIHYDAVGGEFWLYSDIYGYFVGPVKPGVTSSDLSGSACAVSTANSSVQAGGQSLELTLVIASKVAGERNIYLRAMETDYTDTGWVRRAAWTQSNQPKASMSVFPDFGNRWIERFSLAYSDQPGFLSLDKGWTQFLIAADSTGGGQPFCFVHYDRAGKQLWMYSSDVGFFLGPVAPGTSSTVLDSSACMVDTAYSTSESQPGALFLSLPITMKPPMSGPKKLYMRVMDALGIDSGWNQVGTYQVP